MVYRIILIFLIIMSIFSKNKNFALAAGMILIVSFFNSSKVSDFIGKYFLDLGMFFLMIWMLVPFIDNRKEMIINIRNVISIRGIISFICGILVVVLASKGTGFLKGNVDVITGVVTGSVIGIAFLGGVPVGPLIASGIAYELVILVESIFKN